MCEFLVFRTASKYDSVWSSVIRGILLVFICSYLQSRQVYDAKYTHKK